MILRRVSGCVIGATDVAVDRKLKSDRLVLRPFRLGDVDKVFAYHSDPEWSAFCPDPHTYVRADAEIMVSPRTLRDWDKRPKWAIEMQRELIGEISLSLDDGRHGAELGFGIARQKWGNGLASEAATAVVENAFRSIDELSRICAVTDAHNCSARRVLEKVGMQFEGTMPRQCVLPGEQFDLVTYRLLREEWSKPGG